MKEAIGDLWTFPANWRCITTNGIVRNGQLVMGKGVAQQAKIRYPLLAGKLGRWVQEYGNRPFLCRAENLITFPTKHHWKNLSDIKLIERSAKLIVEMADKHKLVNIVLPQPGCGCGGLTWDFVKPWLNSLDERFTVLTK